MIRRLFVALVAFFAVAGQIASLPVAAEETSLKVVATFSILGDLVQQVGGDAVDVEVLVTANADAHTYEPSPEQVVALTEAALIFQNGLGFEPWLDDMLEAVDPDAQVVEVSSGITLRELEHDDEEEVQPGHGDFDPHIWQSVANAIVMVENIRAALVAIDPDNAAAYDENAAEYSSKLEELDVWITEQVAAIPEEHRKLVTSHDTFGYYADRYGLEVIGAPFGQSTESAEPAAREIADLIELIESSGVPAVFADNVQNPALMEQIASDAGVVLAPRLYTDALGDEDSGAATYIEMMRYNTETIVAALNRS